MVTLEKNLTAESLQMSEYFPLFLLSVRNTQTRAQHCFMLQQLHEVTKPICKKTAHSGVHGMGAAHQHTRTVSPSNSTTVKNPVISTNPVMPSIQFRMFFRINPVKSIVRLSKLLSLINAFTTEVDGLFLHLKIKNLLFCFNTFLI